jgi:hypothetical protein
LAQIPVEIKVLKGMDGLIPGLAFLLLRKKPRPVRPGPDLAFTWEGLKPRLGLAETPPFFPTRRSGDFFVLRKRAGGAAGTLRPQQVLENLEPPLEIGLPFWCNFPSKGGGPSLVGRAGEISLREWAGERVSLLAGPVMGIGWVPGALPGRAWRLPNWKGETNCFGWLTGALPGILVGKDPRALVRVLVKDIRHSFRVGAFFLRLVLSFTLLPRRASPLATSCSSCHEGPKCSKLFDDLAAWYNGDQRAA